MFHVPRPLVAAALIATGVAGDRAVALALRTPTAAATAAVLAAPRDTAAATGTAGDAITEHAFAVASPSVVYVANVGLDSGSGVIYDARGDIVTNAHVVAHAKSVRVTFSTGRTLSARVVGADTADDLAVLHVDASGLPAARFAAAGTFQVAQTVLAIGNPLNLQQTVTSGLISALRRTVQEAGGAYLPDAIQTSAPINPGNSGGALVTLEGTVVGIPTLEATDPQNNNGGAAQGIGFAVPSPRIIAVAEQIIARGTVAHTGRAYLGVSVGDPSTASGGTPPAVRGAIVLRVTAGGPAERAGLQAGDVITAVDGAPIAGTADLLMALARARPGATMALTVDRNGAVLTVSAHLGELPA